MARDQEGQLESLFLVQPRIAECGVVQTKILFPESFTAAGALGHRIARQLEMHAAQEGVVLLVDLECRGELGKDAVEGASLDPGRRAVRVAVMRLANDPACDWGGAHPCIGSHCHTTLCSVALTASMCAPSIDSTLSLP